MKKAMILSSGGLDSSVCTSYAVKKYGQENVITASLLYGQRHRRELECAKQIASYYGLKHIEYDISSAMEHTKLVSSLVEGSGLQIDNRSYAEQIATVGKPNTEVPLRNGVFLVVAGSIAMSLFPNEEAVVIYGAHSDDAAGNAYPDCSVEFADTADKLIQLGSRGFVSLERPLIDKNKAGVVKLGLELHTPFNITTSCYHGGAEAEGRCGTCRDRIEAFRANGVIDPIPYAIPIDWSGCEEIDYLKNAYKHMRGIEQ